MLSAGLFRKRMPPSASAFLLTLATVDDLGAARWRRAGRATSRDSQDAIRPLLPGAILVLATCFASNVSPPLEISNGFTATTAYISHCFFQDLRHRLQFSLAMADNIGLVALEGVLQSAVQVYRANEKR